MGQSARARSHFREETLAALIETDWNRSKHRKKRRIRWNPGGTPSQNQELVGPKV